MTAIRELTSFLTYRGFSHCAVHLQVLDAEHLAETAVSATEPADLTEYLREALLDGQLSSRQTCRVGYSAGYGNVREGKYSSRLRANGVRKSDQKRYYSMLFMNIEYASFVATSKKLNVLINKTK